MVMGPDAIRLPLDFAWGPPPIVEDIDEPDYVAFLRDAMYDIHEYARTNLNASLVTTKDRFDKGQFGKLYQKDDLNQKVDCFYKHFSYLHWAQELQDEVENLLRFVF